MNARGWVTRNAGALSQTVNVMLLNGHPNESISAHAHRAGWLRTETFINAVFFWQPYHCYQAYKTDVAWARAYVIEYEYRALQARRAK